MIQLLKVHLPERINAARVVNSKLRVCGCHILLVELPPLSKRKSNKSFALFSKTRLRLNVMFYHRQANVAAANVSPPSQNPFPARGSHERYTCRAGDL
jgi:hypothetical protein